MRDKKRVFIIGTVWPEVASSAAGLRDQNLIDAFLDSNWEVYYLSPSQKNLFSNLLEEMGVKCFSCPANDSEFNVIIQEVKPEVVIFDRFLMEEQFSFRVREMLPEALRVMDTQDLHFLRRARVNALKKGESLSSIFQNKIEFYTEDLFRECASIYRSDLTLVLSSFEIEFLINPFQIPSDLLYYLPFSYDQKKMELKSKFQDTKNFFFIGNFRHAPNADAVQWLHQELWPKIKLKLPEAELHVYGAYPPKEAMALDHARSGFRVFGPLKNHLEKMKEYRINCAPLRVGAGIKGKITDGWSIGVPTLTTPIGAEGLCHSFSEFGGLVANDAEAFVEASVRLYQNEELWNDSRLKGQDFLMKYMDKEKNRIQFIQKIEEALKKKEMNRKNNLIQNILWSEQINRTKYFSKWIEGKNK